MLLLTALLDRGSSPVEKFLKGLVEIQSKRGVVLSVVQCCIMHELGKAARLYEDGDAKTEAVPLHYIQEKYNLERYTISRNAVMLSKESITDKRAVDKKREGKGWVKNVPVEETYGDAPDSRHRAIKLTKKGRDIADLMFR